MNWLAFVSIISAAMAVSFGAIGPALAEGRAVGSRDGCNCSPTGGC